MCVCVFWFISCFIKRLTIQNSFNVFLKILYHFLTLPNTVEQCLWLHFFCLTVRLLVFSSSALSLTYLNGFINADVWHVKSYRMFSIKMKCVTFTVRLQIYAKELGYIIVYRKKWFNWIFDFIVWKKWIDLIIYG